MKHERPLENKVAIITGGSRGIGAAVARRLSSDGAKVVITYSNSRNDADALVQTLIDSGGTALAIRANSDDSSAIRTAVNTTVSKFGSLNILVNNAAILRTGIIDTITNVDVDQMLSINVKSVFLFIQEALRFMKEGDRIVNIGSVSSGHTPIPGLSLYAATKGAIASMTRALARDLGERGITVNNVQPGRIDTDMNPADGPIAEKTRNSIALGHYGKADDVASLVAYLVSSEARFVTGTNMKVDGGTSA